MIDLELTNTQYHSFKLRNLKYSSQHQSKRIGTYHKRVCR